MIQLRNIGNLRASEQSRTISGKAISFDTESSGLPWIEIIHQGAITEETIRKSNIVFTYNHNRDEILARSFHGEGSLHITVEEDGVYFEFEAPQTRFGDEILEQVRRGDIMCCSFAFVIGDNPNAIKRSIREDGKEQVDIYYIDELFDLSAVIDPAYDSTHIEARRAELQKYKDTVMKREEEKEKDELEEKDVTKNDCNIDDSNDIDERTEEEKVEEERESDEEKEEVDTDENDKEQQEEFEEEVKDEEEDMNEEEKQEERKTQKNISIDNKMKKEFSLLRAIRSIANNKPLDSVDAAVISAGAEQLRKAGVEFGGQIQLPNMIDTRAAITVAAEGEDVVATDIYDILTPLRAKNVLAQAGAKFMTGLVGNVQVPVMSASNVDWELETATAGDGAGSFSKVVLTPHRLTAYIDISKQFLAQDGVSAESVIREDLVKAINSKLEATILGSGDGKDQSLNVVAPAGMFNGATVADIEAFADITELEAEVESANVYGECKYIMSPKAKSVLRTMIKGTNATGMVFENNEVDGTPALVTTNVADKKMVYGDFSNLAIGQWGAIDLTVDPFTVAIDGKIRLVINAFFDAKVLRADAFAYGDAGSDASSSESSTQTT